jgi:hypothetical protein
VEGHSAIPAFGVLAVDNPVEDRPFIKGAGVPKLGQEGFLERLKQQVLHLHCLEVVETAFEQLVPKLV